MSEKVVPRTPTTPPSSQRWLWLSLVGAVAVFVGLAVTGGLQQTWVQVVILGVVQGLTEFLPISSTAHLLVVSDLLQFPFSNDGTFEIFIQLGTVVAVVAYYARDLMQQTRSVLTSERTRRFWAGIVLAFIPAALVGLTLRDWLKTVIFETPIVFAFTLIVGGIVFIVIERYPPQHTTTHDVQDATWKQALAIGIAQTTALIPGVSRSGASMVGGMLAGLDRKSATVFSFYLAIPTLGAATVVDLLSSLDVLTPEALGWLVLGAVVAGIVGWLSIAWLLRYVSTHTFVPFGIYRIIAGCAIIVLVSLGWL